MLRKLRRNSKEPVDIDGPTVDLEAVKEPLDQDDDSQPRLTFFDLPAELRNAIYEFVVSDTTLTLPSSLFAAPKRSYLPLKRRKSIPTPINGLLLTSRQCRQEYLSVLLSTVSVVVEVKDFDFESLIRVSSSLGEQEAKALQTNKHLTLQLCTQNCTSKDLILLRRWLEYRRSCKVNLPWRYEFPESLLPSTMMGRVRVLRQLEYFADTISIMVVDVEPDLQPELKAITDAFESRAVWLEDVLGWVGHKSKTSPRNLRGLAGGGVH